MYVSKIDRSWAFVDWNLYIISSHFLRKLFHVIQSYQGVYAEKVWSCKYDLFFRYIRMEISSNCITSFLESTSPCINCSNPWSSCLIWNPFVDIMPPFHSGRWLARSWSESRDFISDQFRRILVGHISICHPQTFWIWRAYKPRNPGFSSESTCIL